ncbi:transposable element Tcb2 transposase [Trichonephila clavipes]|nr:transposable element Tcb2 transposase [Trichonephila clavipes]
MDPQRGLWNCAISTLVHRSSGDKLLGSDLYQEIRLKAKDSFRSSAASSRDAMGLQFLFMDDNAPCHRTVAAEQLLESEDIERMDWPARSPDLNPIEHVWDFLGRRLAARTFPPVTIQLRLALQDEWANASTTH